MNTERPNGDFTPSVERLRREYVEMRAEHYGFTDLYTAEWDRALARHDDLIRAETLETVARDFAPGLNDPAPGFVRGVDQTRAWLRARAAEYRKAAEQ